MVTYQLQSDHGNDQGDKKDHAPVSRRFLKYEGACDDLVYGTNGHEKKIHAYIYENEISDQPWLHFLSIGMLYFSQT